MLSYPHHSRIHGVGTVLHAVFTATGLDVSTKRVLGSQKAQTGSLEHAYRIPYSPSSDKFDQRQPDC